MKYRISWDEYVTAKVPGRLNWLRELLSFPVVTVSEWQHRSVVVEADSLTYVRVCETNNQVHLAQVEQMTETTTYHGTPEMETGSYSWEGVPLVVC